MNARHDFRLNKPQIINRLTNYRQIKSKVTLICGHRLERCKRYLIAGMKGGGWERRGLLAEHGRGNVTVTMLMSTVRKAHRDI